MKKKYKVRIIRGSFKNQIGYAYKNSDGTYKVVLKNLAPNGMWYLAEKLKFI